MISSLEKVGQWLQALHYFEFMCSSDLQPSLVSFNAMISSFEKGEQWQMGICFLQMMQDLEIQPDIFSFNALISCCEKGGHWQTALSFFQSMLEAAVQPVVISYGALISACEKASQWESALQLFEAIPKAQLRPSTTSLNAAISACEKAFRWPESLSLLVGSASSSHVDLISFNAAMSACEKFSQWRWVLHLWSHIQDTTSQAADLVSYCTAISSCDKTSHWQHALLLFMLMQNARIQASDLSLSATVSACAKSGQWNALNRLTAQGRVSFLQRKKSTCVGALTSAVVPNNPPASLLGCPAPAPDVTNAAPFRLISCFADAIPALERRELVNDGQVYPVGLYLIDYAAQHAAAELTAPRVRISVWKYGLQAILTSGSFCSKNTHQLFPGQLSCFHMTGLSLDFYRDYNTSWERPSQYFTTIDQINRSKLMLCEETLLMSVKMMSTYLEITGDHEGVSQGTGGITGRCFDQYFWYAPACRRNSSSCIPCFTGGTGWGSLEMLQKATFLGIPLAWITAKDWNAYSALPKDYDSIFYWWTPDPTFLSLNAEQIMFPAHNGFMRNYNVDIKHVEMIMADQLQSGESYFDAACRWLHANGDWWQQWIPDKTKCFARYGLYNAKEDFRLPWLGLPSWVFLRRDAGDATVAMTVS
eukprot:g29410.t1